jgi:hypothetical protein
MARLTSEHKAFVIRGFARFQTVPEITAGLKEKFGVEVSTHQLYGYHPDSVNFRVSKQWLELFNREREAFLRNVDSIGIANKTVRLQRLEQACVVALARKNIKLAAELMEQAAKEMGEVFTNKREIKSDVRSVTATMTTDELRNEILSDLKALGIDAPPMLQIGVKKDDGTKH